MGIRTLHRRTAQAGAHVDAAPSPPLPSVPAFAPGASTVRIPADLMTALRRMATGLTRRLGLLGPGDNAHLGETSRWRQCADLGRSYLSLALTLLPRSRPVRTVTVFVASVGSLSEPQGGSAPGRPHPDPNRQGPGQDATP